MTKTGRWSTSLLCSLLAKKLHGAIMSPLIARLPHTSPIQVVFAVAFSPFIRSKTFSLCSARHCIRFYCASISIHLGIPPQKKGTKQSHHHFIFCNLYATHFITFFYRVKDHYSRYSLILIIIQMPTCYGEIKKQQCMQYHRFPLSTF